ncbi:hypothetical protein CPAST_c09610 [Clostridium pasteurianum DSM 525 = ATCC 6013]|uniref:Uncharacterized protein n=1 Tax=Clostridium pasteurianum DSM 525 = ATCC 6013 TaxID=1262449 RepID=A0A0H3IZT3_CLOPA|nr:hypothetical protein [Clostridium pasteurianum]AJA47061.1 hypothetical protein CPAST_c09610 [Clostridium pasteurianum DSM 525 = ATCC 6013]AJA51049.1 hypothetical protein CLPA_c09610 [Clostridium pasteurianum DSM 525 = ATCC 6013]AOZ74428.1 hypothetical protein AQ983_04655 [Clostridium pasteurianum DSM 525 = ATCC 6013]AOZ78225.1 hypothetical protein AQ984_04645 [Clostridium pasteurianum]ELP59551.1 hypothetical protein F502_09718 [Clostridium pasteurianum DSM 525 = ATCC 6013]
MNKKNILVFVVIVIIILLIAIFIKFSTNSAIDKNNKINKTIENPFSYSFYINNNWNIKIPNPQKNNGVLSESGTSVLSKLEFSNKDYEEFKNSIEWIDAGHQSEYYIDDFIKYVSDTNLEQKQSDKEKYILLLQDLKKNKKYKFFYKLNTNGYLYFILIDDKPNVVYAITVGAR